MIADRDASPGGDLAHRWPRPQAAYIHVPFCRHRCGYCNFSVLPGRLELVEPFLDALQRELQSTDVAGPLQTWFIGGGTPTRLGPDQLERLLQMMHRHLGLVAGGEVTIEANPEDVTPQLVRQLRSLGVNRISLGIQSLDSSKLAALQRGHDSRAARAAVLTAAATIPNVSIDLIFAAPGETAAVWQSDLQATLQLPITHLSTYSLTFEKGTRFWTRRMRGELSGVDEAEELAMYQQARQMAAAAGLQQYEISNFALPGYHCRHNTAYWQGLGWLAFGPGAARFVQGRREVNHRSPTTYIRRLARGQSPLAESETITAAQWACELAAFGTRMMAGIDIEQIRRLSGCDLLQQRGDALRRLVDRGWLVRRGSRYRLSETGVVMADSVAAELL